MGHDPVLTHREAILADLTDHQADSVLWSLTPRERQVATAVAMGASNHQVATLSMAAKTVECHLGRIYTKLGVSSRIELAVALGIQTLRNPDVRWPDLSPAEQHVVALVGVGMTTRLVAQHLYLSPKTVEYHLGRIYRRLQITSRRQLLNVLGNLNTPGPVRPIPETAA